MLHDLDLVQDMRQRENEDPIWEFCLRFEVALRGRILDNPIYGCQLNHVNNQGFQRSVDVWKNSDFQVLEGDLTPLQTLSVGQVELLHWHQRCNHELMSTVRRLSKQGVIPKLSDAAMTCSLPLCSACQYGKQQRRRWRTSKNDRNKHIVRNHFDSVPGGRMHIDHMECRQPGLIPQARGRLQHKCFVGASLYVDGATGFKLTHLQTSLDSHETLAAKKAIERRCKQMGVEIKNYHSDNGRFAEPTFLDDVAANQQGITHTGVGAHR